jgi:hypothetical protein
MNIEAISSATSLINRILMGSELLIMSSLTELVHALGFDEIENPSYDEDEDGSDVTMAVGATGKLITMITDGASQIRLRNQIQTILYALDVESVEIDDD